MKYLTGRKLYRVTRTQTIYATFEVLAHSHDEARSLPTPGTANIKLISDGAFSGSTTRLSRTIQDYDSGATVVDGISVLEVGNSVDEKIATWLRNLSDRTNCDLEQDNSAEGADS